MDSGNLEDWLRFFLDTYLYKVTTADNDVKGYPVGPIYAASKAMPEDRVLALREANIYERQRYRHIPGMPLIEVGSDGYVAAETSFLVVRTMRDGQMTVFAAGVYLDRVKQDADGAWCYAERIAVCDSRRIGTLLAIPI